MSKGETIDFAKSIVEETGIPAEAFTPMGGGSFETALDIDLSDGGFKNADEDEIKKLTDGAADDAKSKEVKDGLEEKKEDETKEPVKTEFKTKQNKNEFDVNGVIKSAFESNIFSFDSESLDEAEVEKVVKGGGPNALLQYFVDKEIEHRENIRIQELEEDQREFTQLKDSGVDPSVAKQLMHEKLELDAIDKSKLDDNEELAEKINRKYYEKTIPGVTDGKVNKLIKILKDSGLDIESAKENLVELKEIAKKEREEAKNAEIQKERDTKANIEKSVKEISEYIDGIDKIFPELGITNKVKEKTKDALLGKVKTKDGQITNPVTAKMMEDPKKFNAIVGMLYAMGIFDGNAKNLLKTGETNAVNKLDKILKSSEGKIKGFTRHTIEEEEVGDLALQFLKENKKV